MTILHEEKHFLIVDKPVGQLVLPIPKSDEKTLRDELFEKYPELGAFDPDRAGIVHRLDRDTSGLVLVARTPIALKFLQGEFGARRVKKEYTALVHGEVKKERGIIDLPLGRAKSGKMVPNPVHKKEHEAITEYEVIKHGKDTTLLRVMPKTGRMHQIRAHLAAIAHPIVGDTLYGKTEEQRNRRTEKQTNRETDEPRLMLHATKLEFYDPDTKWRTFESPLPEEFQ